MLFLILSKYLKNSKWFYFAITSEKSKSKLKRGDRFTEILCLQSIWIALTDFHICCYYHNFARFLSLSGPKDG